MRCSTIVLQVAVVILVAVSSNNAETKDKRQTLTGALEASGFNNPESGDAQVAETGFAGAVAAGSKYFQYTHVPAKDHYEHGHKRGNEHHFIERHEKAHPHAGEFKTKVRWGDKHGGYGEHYWDYNHDGHDHDGEGGETVQQEQYVAAPHQTEEEKIPAFSYNRRKRNPASDPNSDVEFIDNRARHLVLSGITGKHGGNYRRHPSFERAKRGQKFSAAQRAVQRPFDSRIVDQKTGIVYELKPTY